MCTRDAPGLPRIFVVTGRQYAAGSSVLECTYQCGESTDIAVPRRGCVGGRRYLCSQSSWPRLLAMRRSLAPRGQLRYPVRRCARKANDGSRSECPIDHAALVATEQERGIGSREKLRVWAPAILPALSASRCWRGGGSRNQVARPVEHRARMRERRREGNLGLSCTRARVAADVESSFILSLDIRHDALGGAAARGQRPRAA